MRLRVTFRTDASLEIGTGHVMRCLTLADALRRQGATCRFLMRRHAGHLETRVRAHGFDVTLLNGESSPHEIAAPIAPPPHAHWLDGPWQTDAAETLAALGPYGTDWLIVDHYALDTAWEQHVAPACRRLMVIDDLVDRAHHCHLLLDQNLGRTAEDYAALVPTTCLVLSGPQHALLRPDFATWRPQSLSRRHPARLQHVLVAMGGIDPGNSTGRVLASLEQAPLPEGSHVSVVLGRQAPWLDSVREQAAALRWSSEVLVDIDHMARLMTDCDLAIGGAGGTAWERCCLGLPALLIVLAENQRAGAQALEKAGAALTLTDRPDLGDQIVARITELKHGDTLSAMSTAASDVTDGHGLDRVLPHLLGSCHG